MDTIRIALFTLCVWSVLQLNVCETTFRYKTRFNYRFIANHTFESITTSSFMRCASYCATKPGCMSVSWKSVDEPCSLSEYSSIDVYSTNRILEYAYGWRTTSKIIYPVFHAQRKEGPGHRYQLTFTSALNKCNEYDTEMATEAMVLSARAMGYESCYCGWMKDGRNGFVLQTYDQECWSSFSTGIILCDGTFADVYCVMK